MTESSITITKSRLIILILAIIAVAYLGVRYVVSERLSELQLETALLISEQEVLLATIAETTARNGADEITEQIIIDCSISERTRFDDLLSRLNVGLSRGELTELERLFGRCGNFYAERKSVMVARLEREIEIYKTFVEQLSNLADSDKQDTYQVATWEQLAALERKQSELFYELVNSQDRIISTLLEGKSPTSQEITTILESVQSTQQSLIVTHTQAAEIRSVLVSL